MTAPVRCSNGWADVVVGFGGYVALPAYLAARGTDCRLSCTRDQRGGIANKIGARLTEHVGPRRGDHRCGTPGSAYPLWP